MKPPKPTQLGECMTCQMEVTLAEIIDGLCWLCRYHLRDQDARRNAA